MNLFEKTFNGLRARVSSEEECKERVKGIYEKAKKRGRVKIGEVEEMWVVSGKYAPSIMRQALNSWRDGMTKGAQERAKLNIPGSVQEPKKPMHQTIEEVVKKQQEERKIKEDAVDQHVKSGNYWSAAKMYFKHL